MSDLSLRIDAGQNAERLLVLLHGYGATQHDLASIIPAIDPDGRLIVLSPLAPMATPGGGASWYDFDDAWRADPSSFYATLDMLDRLIETVCRQFVMDRSDAVIGGFSQGAGMAAWLAFATRSAVPAGFWCCGTIVDVDDQPLDLTSARDCHVLTLAGRSDPNVPLERSRAQGRRLELAGARLTVSEHPGGHGLGPAMLADMNRWLATFSRPLDVAR